ncbi:MAG: replication factor C large subunit [Candidatus Pacearchaeota archaeon]|nr:replication factor C large subunit [Candidatus Pacearchaeota archaeon]
MLPFTEKYKPKFEEVACSQEAKTALREFILGFKKQKRKAVLLHGPSGSGKTSLVYALASQLGYEIIELNASDFRNRQNIHEIIGKALRQKSLFSKGKIILLDELEGISETKDKGCIPEIIRLIDTTSWPIVLITNDAWQAKLSPLRSKAILIELKKCDKTVVAKVLAKIAAREKIPSSMEALEAIALINEGDIRASINDLQTLAALKKPLSKSDAASLHVRERDESIFKALQTILKSRAMPNAFDNVQSLDYDDFFLWLDENIPREYRGTELAKAYDIMSKADVFRGRIRRWQYWRFLVYILALLSYGVSNVKEESKRGFTSYKPPSRILKIWLSKQRQTEKREMAEKIAKLTHTSNKRAYKELPFLEIAFKNSAYLKEV